MIRVLTIMLAAGVGGTAPMSDGDLRRLLGDDDTLLDRSVADCMHPEPHTIDAEELASAALERMESNRITSLFACDAERRIEGAIHLHDLWRVELF